MPATTVVSMWVVTGGPTAVLVTAVVNPALVDRWICIAVAADGALAWFFHVSDTVFPLLVALRPLGAAGRPTTVRVKDWVAPGLTPFLAVILNVCVPPVPAAGVPEIRSGTRLTAGWPIDTGRSALRKAIRCGTPSSRDAR